MAKEIVAGSTDQTIDIFIPDSSSTTGGGLTGLVYNSSGLTCYYRKGATGSWTQLTLATQTIGGAHSDGGFVEGDATNAPGMYRLDLSDTMVDTAGLLKIILKGATNMAPVPIEVEVKAGDAYTETLRLKYAGPLGPGIYYDDSAGNTNTTLGTDGTELNPVSSLAAATTLATSLGSRRIYVIGNSVLALTGQTITDYEFVGEGVLDRNTVNLGTAASPSTLAGCSFRKLTVYGTHSFANRIELFSCFITDAPAAETTKLRCYAEKCGLVDDFLLDTSNDNIFEACFSAKAGDAYPVITATGSAGTVVLRHYSGGIGFEDLSASHNVSVETDGQVVFESGCNVNATVVLRGMLAVTDNTAGMANLTTNAAFGPVVGVAGAGLTRASALAQYQGAIWYDDSAGNTDTEFATGDIDGTPTNPVSEEAAVMTLLASSGFDTVRVIGNSTFVLAAAFQNKRMIGDDWSLALGGQNIDGSHFEGFTDCTGIGVAATTPPSFHRGKIGVASAATIDGCEIWDCTIDEFVCRSTLDSYVFNRCHGADADIDCNSLAAIAVSVNDWSGKLTISNSTSATVNVHITGSGQLIEDVSSTDGSLIVSGTWSTTYNGSMTRADTAVWNEIQIADLPTNAELATALITGFTTALTEGYRSTGATGSIRDILYEMLSLMINMSISGTTMTTKKLDKTTTAKTYNLNSSTTPTSIEELS